MENERPRKENFFQKQDFFFIVYEKQNTMNGQWLSPHEATGRRVLSRLTAYMKPHLWYTIIVFDPDAVGGNKIHYTIVNQQEGKKGNVVFPYERPHPPRGSGLHTYIILVIRQDHHVDVVTTPRTRRMSLCHLFSLLSLDGEIIHSDFFFSSDEYPQLS